MTDNALLDHLDDLNDLVLEYTYNEGKAAQRDIERYCDEVGLDADGFELEWIDEAYVVSIR